MTNISTVSSYQIHAVSDPISDQVMKIILIVNPCLITGLVSFFGTISNIINTIVFIKQGFKDATNISLLAIAVADTGALVTLFWGTLCQNPLIILRLQDFEMLEILYLTSAWPHVYFVRVTGFLTCLVTIERYLCIAYPLKVRRIVTPRRQFIISVTIFAIMAADVLPVFISIQLGPKISLSKNRTVIGTIYRWDSRLIRDVVSSFSNFAEVSSFVLVAFLTVMLVYKLNRKAKWRNSRQISYKSETASTKDRKVVKMVVFISINFIVCFFPVVVIFFLVNFVRDLSITGRYMNLYNTLGTSVFLMEAVNSSANIFIYLKMSSKYRQIFLSMFKKT